MAYLKPGLFVRKVFNKLAMQFGISGAATLVTTGRVSGQPHKVPVIPVDHEGARYLVSTRGEAEWVANLRKTPQGQLTSGSVTEAFNAVEVPVGDRAPIIAAYKVVAGKVVESYFAALPEPADHPIFRIERTA